MLTAWISSTVDSKGNISNRIAGEPEQMRLVAEAILVLISKEQS